MKAAGDEDILFDIQLGHRLANEITASALQKYDNWLHEKVFPPTQPALVKELAGDGHEKVVSKLCQGERPPMIGPHGRDGCRRGTTNGWFMIADPQTGRVLSVVQ